MILSKEQINRYLRHIIIPEISGQGQKKLLETTVCIYGENVNDLLPLILYLSAMGIGNIFCFFKDESGYDSLFYDAFDLNNDIKIQLITDKIIESDFRIVVGNCNFLMEDVNVNQLQNSFVPTILCIQNQWKFLFRTFIKSNEFNDFIELLKIDSYNNHSVPFVTALSGALSSIEGVKLCLNIGNIRSDILIIDLLHMEFNNYEYHEVSKAVSHLFKTENISSNEFKEKLIDAKVLIVGAGGLGSPTSLALAMSGVGTIGFVDSDKVEISNLNRQILHSVSRIGMPKAESAKMYLNKINANLNIRSYIENLTKENVNEIIEDYDLVVSAVDNIQTRYLINDACYFVKKPVIEAGVLRFDGTNTTIIPDEGHCYRCLYPNLNTSGMSCAETGVLGAVPGAMGFIQAAEAYKIITGQGTTLKNKILLFDGLEMEFNVINLERNPDCPICGKKPSIIGLQDYIFKCQNNVVN